MSSDSNNDININNLINYDGDSIQEFRELLFKCKLKHIIKDEHCEDFSSYCSSLRWQQIHGDPQNDRSEISEMIEFIKELM